MSMIATLLHSSGSNAWLWLLLLLAIGFMWVWKPLREFINEWRLVRICRKYHQIALLKSTPKKGGTQRRQEGKKLEGNNVLETVLKDMLNRCFLSIVKFIVEVLAFLCRESVHMLSDGIIMIASLLRSNEKVDAGEIHEVSPQFLRTPLYSPVKNSTSRNLPAASTMPPSMSMVPQSAQVELLRNRDMADNLPQATGHVESPILTLHGESIEPEENHSLYVQHARRLRPLSPSKRLRRVNIDSLPRREEAQIVAPHNATNIRVSIQGSVTQPKGAGPIDTFSLSEQMNKRRMDGTDITFGEADAKKRRIVNGRASLQGCARRPVSRARLTKRVKAEREEVILEGMSRKRPKPNPGTESKITVAASSIAQSFQFGEGNQAAASGGHTGKVFTPPVAPIVFGQNNETTTVSSSNSATPVVFGKNEAPASKSAETSAARNPADSVLPVQFGNAAQTTGATTAISAASTTPDSVPTARQTPQPFTNASHQSSTVAGQSYPVPFLFGASTSTGDGQHPTQDATSSFGVPQFGFQHQSTPNYSVNGTTPAPTIASSAPPAKQTGTPAVGVDGNNAPSSNLSHHRSATLPFSTSQVISLGAGREVGSKSVSGPIFGHNADNGSTPSFPIASCNFGDGAPKSSVAASAINPHPTYGGNSQDGYTQALKTNPGPSLEGSNQNISTPTFTTANLMPSFGGSSQIGPPSGLSIGSTFRGSNHNRSTEAFSSTAQGLTFGGSNHNSSTPAFSTAGSSSAFGGNSQSDFAPAFPTANGDKSSSHNTLFGDNSNHSAGEQKENTNPFGFSGGSSGFVQTAPFLRLEQGGAANSIKTQPTDGLKSFWGNNGFSQTPGTNGTTSGSGIPNFAGENTGFVPGSAGASTGSGTSRTRGRPGRRRPR